MVVKVKEPLASEYGFFRKDLVLYTYLHLAAEPELTRTLAKSGVAGIAYETIQLEDGALPLLKPMSEVAGRMAVQVGATCLEKERGGKGVLLGGVPGTRRGRVAILGGGVVGRNAATIAVGMGAQVTVLDVRGDTMAYLEDVFGGAIETLYSNPTNIEESCMRADLVIGAVLVTGAAAPKLVSRGARRQDEQGQRHRRRRGRPGRLHRDVPSDDARSPDLRGRRRRALLRREHAGRGAAHEHVGADEHDDAVRGEDRRAGPRRRRQRRTRRCFSASTRSAAT